MTLRSKIEAAIESAQGETAKAALEVCRLLELEIGLQGNGWFDDDPELLERFLNSE